MHKAPISIPGTAWPQALLAVTLVISRHRKAIRPSMLDKCHCEWPLNTGLENLQTTPKLGLAS